jgi:hypothetical protein
MKFSLLLGALVLMVGCRHAPPIHQLAGTPNWQPDPAHAAVLTNEEANGNGIEVGAPKIYDDASLRMMLDATRAKLAAMSGLNQDALISRLGSVNGATISQTQAGLQVAGPVTPSVATTNTGATSSATTSSTAPGVVTVATAPTQSTVTTSPSVPAVPAVPSGIAFTPPSGVSPSSLDVLNEQMQLSYEMANMQLLLEGALSDRFVTNQRFIKPRVTLGFPISLRAPVAFKDDAAVVEVEVETSPRNLSDPKVPEPPAITALLPREKTYNVAAITDHMTSIGGGAVIGTVGVTGSYLTGHKTFYLVQDQDTVAFERPTSANANVTSFLWEFRPVLGQHFVRGGMKQTFVQLALPILDTADCFGSIRIRTYWRRFDQKNGVTGDVIPESVLASTRTFPISRFDLAPAVDAVSYEDLSDGTVLVTVKGSYLAGTYVQFGPARYDAGKNLVVEDTGLQFTVASAAVARWTGHIVARNGEASDILNPLAQKRLRALQQTACTAPAPEEPVTQPTCPEAFSIGKVTVIPLDEATSSVRVEIASSMARKNAQDLLLDIGGRVLGLSDAPVRRESPTGSPIVITAAVPTALLIASPRIRVFRPFWSDVDGDGLQCYDASYALTDIYGPDAVTERLVLLSVDADGNAVYLLYGNRLEHAKVLLPADATLESIANVNPDHIRLMRIKKAAIESSKKIVLQKEDGQRPLLLDLEDSKQAPPKVSVDSPVILNTDELSVAAEQAANVVSVKLDGKALQWKPVDSSTIRLVNLKAEGVTSEQKSREIAIGYKNGTTATLKFEVVAARVGVK